MTWTLLGIGYGACWLATAFVVTVRSLREDSRKGYEPYATASATTGLILGIVWPLIVIVGGLALAARSYNDRTDTELRRRRLDDREREIERLERELGIGR